MPPTDPTWQWRHCLEQLRNSRMDSPTLTPCVDLCPSKGPHQSCMRRRGTRAVCYALKLVPCAIAYCTSVRCSQWPAHIGMSCLATRLAAIDESDGLLEVSRGGASPHAVVASTPPQLGFSTYTAKCFGADGLLHEPPVSRFKPARGGVRGSRRLAPALRCCLGKFRGRATADEKAPTERMIASSNAVQDIVNTAGY